MRIARWPSAEPTSRRESALPAILLMMISSTALKYAALAALTER
jgi:hypothetical protein